MLRSRAVSKAESRPESKEVSKPVSNAVRKPERKPVKSRKGRNNKMYMYNRKMIMAMLLLTVVAIMAVFPVSAYAAEGTAPGAGNPGSPGGTSNPGGNPGQKTRVTQEFTYKAGGKPNIPETISQFGQTLTLVSVSEPVENSSLPETRTYNYEVSKSYTPDQLSQAPKNVKLTSVYGDGSRQVDRKETIRNLPNNDVEKLPKKMSYADTNGRGPGAKADGDLVLAEVKYEVESLDKDGLPNKYTAHVVYRGEETYSVLLYYMATTTYTDTRTGDGAKTFTVVATYEGDAPADEATGDAWPPAPAPGEPDGFDSSIGVAGQNGQDGGSEAINLGIRDTGPAGPLKDLQSGLSLFMPPPLQGVFMALSPIGMAALATIIAAAAVLAFLSFYNRRKFRESYDND